MSLMDKLAVQLFTLRDACGEDFPGTLDKLGKMGWAGVQMAGYHGYEPDRLAELIEQNGMKVAGLHVQLPALLERREELAREAALFGTRDLICSNTPDTMRNADGFREMKKRLSDIANELGSAGLRISYHNHAFEFDTLVEGRSALAYLLEPADDNPLLAEIDVYWVRKAGFEPLDFIRSYAGRMPIIHLKDMTDDAEATFAEIGTGAIDFPPILQWGEQSGVEWYVVEQDRCRRDPLESLRISYRRLTEMASNV